MLRQEAGGFIHPGGVLYNYQARHGPNERHNMNTKAIARKAGTTTARVNETARDLGIKMTYRADNRYWQVADAREAARLVEHLTEQLSS